MSAEQVVAQEPGPVEAAAVSSTRPLVVTRISRTLKMTLAKFLKRPSKAMVSSWSSIVKATVVPREVLEEVIATGLKGYAYEINGEKRAPYALVKGEPVNAEKVFVSVQLLPVPKGSKHSLAVQFCAKD